MGRCVVMRLSLVLGLIVAAVGASIGAERLGDYPLTALGLDSQQPIAQNLAVLSDPREMIEGMWGGSIGAFDVTLSGNLTAPPDVIAVSTLSLYSQQTCTPDVRVWGAQSLPKTTSR